MASIEPHDPPADRTDLTPAQARTADEEAQLVLAEFLPTDQVVRKRVFSSLLRGLTRGTS